jgi:hypothetical protein
MDSIMKWVEVDVEFTGAAVIAAYMLGAVAMYLQYARPF